MRRVLMLGAGPLQVPAIRCLKDLGCFVICTDYDAHAPGFAIADQCESVSTIDNEGVLSLAQEARVDFVITSTTDAPVRTAAYVSEQMGLFTGISYEDAICATHKDAMRDRLFERGVPIPEYHICNDAEAFSRAIEKLRGCCVIKPADSAASRGVVLLNRPLSPKESDELFEREIGYSRKGTLMVEERMVGPEVSVEAITIDGETSILAITDKLVTSPPYCVELGHCEQSTLPDSVKEAIKQVAYDAIDAIGIKYGASHTEIMVTPEGPKVVEIAARLGGDYITSKLVPLATGVDMVEASVRAALHMRVDITPRFNRGSAIRFITARTGKIDSIVVDPKIRLLPGFEDTVLYKKKGDFISEPHSSNDRIGHVICSGSAAEAAKEAVDKALEMIHVSVS